MNAAIFSIVLIVSITCLLALPAMLVRRLMKRIEREAAERRHMFVGRVCPGVRAPGNAAPFSRRPERNQHNG